MSDQNYILLVDDELDILGIEEITLKTCYDGAIIKASSGNDAMEIVKAKGAPEIVISDYRMPNGDGSVLFKFIRENHPGSHFIVCSGNPKGDLESIFQGAFAIIEKPAIIAPILQAVKQLAKRTIRPEDFIPIMLPLVHPSHSLPYDYYLRLSENNIVKLYKKGDSLYQEDLKKLQEKGVETIYITQGDCLIFLKEFEAALSDRLNRELDPEQIVSLSFESLGMVEKLAKTLGWNQQFLEFAKKNITAAVTVLSRDVALSNIIKSKLSDPSSAYNKHVFLTSLIGCAFCNYLGFTTESAQMKMAMAAVLHDIFVDEKCYQDIDSWNRSALSRNESDAQVTKYRNHPIETSNYVLSMNKLPPDVDQIIAQHHERPEGSGFPRGVPASRISHLSSLFIMTEDMAHLLLKSVSVEEAIERYLLWGDDFYNTGNFKKIFATIRGKLREKQFSTSA